MMYPRPSTASLIHSVIISNQQKLQSIMLLLVELLLLHSSLLLLLLSSHGLQSTEGRGLHYQLKEPADPKVRAEEGTAAAAEMSAALIGSRPPRCEGRCAPCGRCEAVQVPVAAPRVKRAAGHGHFRLSGAFGDESSTNYKPLNWKCRCADRRILNP